MIPPLLTLDAALDPGLAGHKAASLARLRGAGHPVPDGFVLPAGCAGALDEALVAARLAFPSLGGPVAVRSSGLAEDLEGASFAGQYETVLDVRDAEGLEAAIRHCLDAAHAERVRTYRVEHGVAEAPLAVLVQRMVPAKAAGTAFTAHPVTGERGVVVISAVAGLGEALVSGLADAEEWEVRASGASCVRHADLLGPDVVEAVAALARAVAGEVPTDIEWAWDGARVHLLQARPMTAVPEPVSWEVSAPGAYLRHFRLGEWIGAPLTPLSESWLVTDIERRMHGRFSYLFGIPTPEPLHVVVHGWYFYGGLNFDMSDWRTLLRALPTMLWNLLWHFREMMSTSAKHLGFHQEWARWRRDLLPAWRATVREAEAAVDGADAAGLLELLQRLVDAAGVQFTSMVGVAGYGASSEFELRKWVAAHAPDHQWRVPELIAFGRPQPAAHDVEGLDWVFPTLGERGPVPKPPPDRTQAARAAADRVVEEVREALPPARRKRFDHLLNEARLGYEACQEQGGTFTLGWPVMRRALQRLAEGLGLPDGATLCFLTREELLDAVRAGRTVDPQVLAARRSTWERQRRLSPPLMVGERVGLYKLIFDQIEGLLHHEHHDDPNVLVGIPGSPGQASGIARVVRRVEDLDRLRPGEILVAPVTTPAWTVAFGRAAAVVTDTGSVGSHAAIVAREHGLPAVVATGKGTSVIADGAFVQVDGSTGTVRLLARSNRAR